MHPLYAQSNALTADVIGAAIEVFRHFGPGLLESIYTRSLARELMLRGHRVQTEKLIRIEYKGFVFEETLRFDLMVNECLLVEAKVSEKWVSGLRTDTSS